MSYAMRKTPRSSFMVRHGGIGDDATATIVSPGIVPTVAMPPTPAPTPSDTSSGLTRYVLWGGLAYLAYWLWSKE